MQNPVICILCGLPGAGKTTLCQRLLSMTNTIPILHISYDDLIGWLNLSSDSDDKKWKEARASVANFVERVVECLKAKQIHPSFSYQDYELLNKTHLRTLIKNVTELISKEESCCLLIDDNMFYKSMRKVYYQLAARLSTGVCVVFLSCSLDVCTERLQNRPGNQIDGQTLARMNDKMEIPDEKNLPQEAGLLNINGSNWSKNCQILTTLIKDCSEKPLVCVDTSEEEKAREETRALNVANTAHQADICMRKIVKQCFTDSHDLPDDFVDVVKSNTKLISMAKKVILKQINSNQLDLSFLGNKFLHEDDYKVKFEAELIQLLIAYVKNH